MTVWRSWRKKRKSDSASWTDLAVDAYQSTSRATLAEVRDCDADTTESGSEPGKLPRECATVARPLTPTTHIVADKRPEVGEQCCCRRYMLDPRLHELA